MSQGAGPQHSVDSKSAFDMVATGRPSSVNLAAFGYSTGVWTLPSAIGWSASLFRWIGIS